MPLPVIADVYRITLIWTNGSTSAANVLHIRRSASNASAVATLVDGSAQALQWDPVQSTAVVTQLRVTPLDGTGATYVMTTSGAKWTGRTAGEAVPAQAAIISFRTALRGPRNRGRIYLPWTGEASQSNGQIAAASITNMNTGWTAFLAALAAGGGALVIASYVGAVANNVTSYLVETQSATQRRRQSRQR
jgi:F0F1-type ATP synthase membrane subunit c/vacuolar-type H+-ATPase subunit K